ncbi:MAG: binding-protein-dependent transport permease [Oscillospiraceae bacterium]|nr:binding-protein-dependent transport permease [Oscillospiraceae bacterium]
MKAILAFVVTLVLGILTMAWFDTAPELGVLVGVAVMGAFIIGFGTKK